MLLQGCTTPSSAPRLDRYEFARAAMGTQFRITLYAPDQQAARSAADTAFDRIDTLDDILSDYQADSELSLLREAPPGIPVKASQDLLDVLCQARAVSRKTQGVFDVTFGPYTRLWRFSRKRKTLPGPAEIEEARRSVGFEKLLLDESARTVTMTVPGMRLDVGGIAKGYAADEALLNLQSLGFRRALVAASGDIAIGDPPPGQKGWTVAVSYPGASDTNHVRKFTLRNAGISTSGDTEQFIEINRVLYSHILDPATGHGMTNRVQATVIAPCATVSDSLATALRILGPERGAGVIANFPHTVATIITFEHGRTNLSVLSGHRGK
jgi:thiamine biosynthesis lipoprotein